MRSLSTNGSYMPVDPDKEKALDVAIEIAKLNPGGANATNIIRDAQDIQAYLEETSDDASTD